MTDIRRNEAKCCLVATYLNITYMRLRPKDFGLIILDDQRKLPSLVEKKEE